jgi:hypothetical protein
MQPADIEPFAWRPAARRRGGVTFIVTVALVAAATGYLVGGGGKKTQPPEVPRSKREEPGGSNTEKQGPSKTQHEAVGNQRTNERAAKPHDVRSYRELRDYMLAR